MTISRLPNVKKKPSMQEVELLKSGHFGVRSLVLL
jgi:hypothetical protein